MRPSEHDLILSHPWIAQPQWLPKHGLPNTEPITIPAPEQVELTRPLSSLRSKRQLIGAGSKEVLFLRGVDTGKLFFLK